MKKTFVISLFAILFCSCSMNNNIITSNLASLDTLVKKESFQKEINGKKVDLFTLRNDSGMIVKITNYGGRIVSVLIPTKKNNYVDVTLGYSNLETYFKDPTYSGALIGRYANRIRNGKFQLDKQAFTLATNNKPNSLHGGNIGFDKVVWDANQSNDSLVLNYVAKDMEEGYPGELKVEARYILTN